MQPTVSCLDSLPLSHGLTNDKSPATAVLLSLNTQGDHHPTRFPTPPPFSTPWPPAVREPSSSRRGSFALPNAFSPNCCPRHDQCALETICSYRPSANLTSVRISRQQLQFSPRRSHGQTPIAADNLPTALKTAVLYIMPGHGAFARDEQRHQPLRCELPTPSFTWNLDRH